MLLNVLHSRTTHNSKCSSCKCRIWNDVSPAEDVDYWKLFRSCLTGGDHAPLQSSDPWRTKVRGEARPAAPPLPFATVGHMRMGTLFNTFLCWMTTCGSFGTDWQSAGRTGIFSDMLICNIFIRGSAINLEKAFGVIGSSPPVWQLSGVLSQRIQ